METNNRQSAAPCPNREAKKASVEGIFADCDV